MGCCFWETRYRRRQKQVESRVDGLTKVVSGIELGGNVLAACKIWDLTYLAEARTRISRFPCERQPIPLHGNFGNCAQWRDLDLFGYFSLARRR